MDVSFISLLSNAISCLAPTLHNNQKCKDNKADKEEEDDEEGPPRAEEGMDYGLMS